MRVHDYYNLVFVILVLKDIEQHNMIHFDRVM